MRRILFTFLLLTLIGCGSGGGGGSDFDELKGATVNVRVAPDSIGVGDRTLVRVSVRQIHPDGVIVVLRYSAQALDMVPGTAKFQVGRDTVQLNPSFGPANRGDWDYVTFYLPQSAFGDENSGELSLQLLGERRNPDALVEVDERVHTPGLQPEQEFSLADPNFNRDDRKRVNVRKD